MGLTDQGFTPETLQEIKDRIIVSLQDTFGTGINTGPTSRFGQLTDIFASESESLWDALQADYNSRYPNLASGVSLDNVNSITNVARLNARSSQGAIYLGGSVGAVDLGEILQQESTDEQFSTQLVSSISDIANLITISEIPTIGGMILSWDAEAIATIDWDDTDTDIKTKIEGHSKITDVTVTGTLNTTRGFHLEFISDTLTSRNPTIDSSNLFRGDTVLPITATDSATTNNFSLTSSANDGQATISWDAESIAPILWNDSIVIIKSKIEGHSGIADVTVIGTFDTGNVLVTFVTETLASVVPTIESESLVVGSEAVSAEANFGSETTVPVLSINTGQIDVPVSSLSVATSSQFDTCMNFEQGTAGADKETDAEYRERRTSVLQKAGTTSAAGAKEAISEVANVDTVTIVENDTPNTDADGRPRNTYEVYVEGAAASEDDIAASIYATKPLGIGVVSTVDPGEQRTGDYVDVNGESRTLTFSTAVQVPMLIVVTGTFDADFYPTEGDDQINQALLNHFLQLNLGEDVLNHLLYTPVNTVPGIITVAITQDTVASGVPSSANTAISISELATLVDGNITVTMVEA